MQPRRLNFGLQCWDSQIPAFNSAATKLKPRTRAGVSAFSQKPGNERRYLSASISHAYYHSLYLNMRPWSYATTLPLLTNQGLARPTFFISSQLAVRASPSLLQFSYFALLIYHPSKPLLWEPAAKAVLRANQEESNATNGTRNVFAVKNPASNAEDTLWHLSTRGHVLSVPTKWLIYSNEIYREHSILSGNYPRQDNSEGLCLQNWLQQCLSRHSKTISSSPSSSPRCLKAGPPACSTMPQLNVRLVGGSLR